MNQDLSPKMPLNESPNPVGSDPVLESLMDRNVPPTLENYLALAYPDGVPDPMPEEQRVAIPRFLLDPRMQELAISGRYSQGLADALSMYPEVTVAELLEMADLNGF